MKNKQPKNHISKKQIFKLAKEEAKDKVTQDVQSKVIMPYDIKKIIDSDITADYAILDDVGYPTSDNFDKILQCMKEISINSVKKIRNSIQRIKATEKKLKELERKASENLKKKSKCYFWLIRFYFTKILHLRSVKDAQQLL